MPDRLHWNTVKPILKEMLTVFMQNNLFDPFRLVGGTSLSLQLGNRRPMIETCSQTMIMDRSTFLN